MIAHDEERQRVIAEAVRLQEKYQRDVIERFGICPWAKQTREAGRLRTHVVLELETERAAVHDVVARWVNDAAVDVAFVIAPNFSDGFEPLAQWGRDLAVNAGDTFYSAAFHPGAEPGAGVVRFFRQSPNPTIQLVRRTRLEEVRAQDPSHYADIFSLTLQDLEAGCPRKTTAAAVLAHNERVLETEGREALQSLMSLGDRDAS
ncbi:MAG: hypothetical protein AAF436_10090 [Myxococcota bacterium]